MKKRTVILIAGALALLLILALVGLPLLSRLYYGRSQAATLFAWQLDKEEYVNSSLFTEYLNEKRVENAAPYFAPLPSEFEVSFVARRLPSLTYYVLNQTDNAERIMFYFPGGSYIDQPRTVHWQFLNALARETGLMIVVPLYPKLPEADAQASYDALRIFYDSVMEKQDPEELIFMGDSAGGGIALSLAMQLRDAGVPGPDRLVLLCPWLDVTLSNPDIPAYEKKDPALDSQQLRHLGELWAGELSPRDPIVSPLYGSFEELGEITLITGTGELLYPDIRDLDERLTEDGIRHGYIEASGMFHVWPLYFTYSIPEAEQTFDEILQLLQAD